jgi:hypothetical protein
MRVNSEGRKRVGREKKNNEEISGGEHTLIFCLLFNLSNLLKKVVILNNAI